MRRRLKKALTIIEGILFVVFFVSMSAMDSEAWWIPATTFVVSGIGFYICYLIEVRCGYAR